MYFNKKLFMLAVVIVTVTTSSFSQNKIIDVWNGKVPGSIKIRIINKL